MPKALLQGDNPFRTRAIFHPVGADLELTTSSPLVAAVTWPIREGLGLAAQVNTVQLLSMFLAATATYFLALRVCRHRGAAFIAGAAFAMFPGRMVHVDSHLNLIETACIPFGLLLVLRFVEVPTMRRAAALGATCGATFLIDPQLAVLLGIGVLALAIVHRKVVLANLRPLLSGAGVAALVAAPLLVPMALAIAHSGVGEPDPTRSTLQYSSSPLAWVVPPVERLWVGRVASWEPLMPNAEGVAYPGLAMLALAVAGTSFGGRDRRRGWVAISLVAFVLSLGPYIYVRDTYLPLPMPFFLFRAVPGLDAMRVPGRFALLGSLGIYVLAAIALSDIARRGTRATRLATLLVGVVTVVELFPATIVTRDDTAPAAYEVLARDTSGRAVLELPLKWSTTQQYYGFEGTAQDFRFLLYQLEHDHPIVSGAVSRFRQDDLDRLVGDPIYRQVLALADQPGFDERPEFDAADLARLGIGFVVYHRDDPAPGALRYIESLGLPVLADDGTVKIWAVPQ
jgi:hypothetical protein